MCPEEEFVQSTNNYFAFVSEYGSSVVGISYYSSVISENVPPYFELAGFIAQYGKPQNHQNFLAREHAS